MTQNLYNEIVNFPNKELNDFNFVGLLIFLNQSHGKCKDIININTKDEKQGYLDTFSRATIAFSKKFNRPFWVDMVSYLKKESKKNHEKKEIGVNDTIYRRLVNIKAGTNDEFLAFSDKLQDLADLISQYEEVSDTQSYTIMANYGNGKICYLSDGSFQQQAKGMLSFAKSGNVEMKIPYNVLRWNLEYYPREVPAKIFENDYPIGNVSIFKDAKITHCYSEVDPKTFRFEKDLVNMSDILVAQDFKDVIMFVETKNDWYLALPTKSQIERHIASLYFGVNAFNKNVFDGEINISELDDKLAHSIGMAKNADPSNAIFNENALGLKDDLLKQQPATELGSEKIRILEQMKTDMFTDDLDKLSDLQDSGVITKYLVLGSHASGIQYGMSSDNINDFYHMFANILLMLAYIYPTSQRSLWLKFGTTMSNINNNSFDLIQKQLKISSLE